MSTILPIHIEPLLLLGVFILLLVVTALLIWLLRNSQRSNELSYPIYDYIVKQAEHKAQEITYDAMKKSRDMLVEAELKGTKIIAKERVESRNIEKEYEEKLHELTEETRKLLDTYAKEAHKNSDDLKGVLSQYAKEAEISFKDLTESLSAAVSSGIGGQEKVVREETVKMTKHMQATFSALEDRFKNQMDTNLKKEFAAAKEVIKTYRKQQLDLVDSYIVTLVERTVALALGKKFSVAEHASLIHEALEEAKSHGIFK